MKTEIEPWEILSEAYAIVRADILQIVGRFSPIIIFFVVGQILFIHIFLLSFIVYTLASFSAFYFALFYVEQGHADITTPKKQFIFDILMLKFTWRKFVAFFTTSLLVVLAIVGGWILLLLPSIIVAVQLRFAKLISLEKNIRPREALRESVRITKGNRSKILEYMAISVLINLIGFFCFFIGLFFTMPMTLIGLVLIYKKLTTA
jgi:uncharacterized membrane protein